MKIQSIQGYEREVRRLLGAHEKEISAYALGLAGEAGEVVDLLKKSWGHGHPLDAEKLKKELGDTLWYVVALALQFGLTIDQIAPRRLIFDSTDRGSLPLNLIGVVGRVCRLVERCWYHAPFGRELGDDDRFLRILKRDLRLVWDYVEQLGVANDISLGAILQANVDKLWLRYPDGFSTEASIARVDVQVGVGHAVETVSIRVPENSGQDPTIKRACQLDGAGVSTVGHDTAAAIDRFVVLRAPALDSEGRDPIDAGREF